MLFLEATLIAATGGLLVSPYPMLALLPGVLTVAGLLMVRYPALALYAIIFLIPFGALRKLGGINLPWVFAAFLLALLFLQVTVRRRLPSPGSSALWPLLLAYMGISLVSALLSDYPETAHYELFLIISAYIFILLVIAFLPQDGFRHRLPRVIAWSLSLGSLLSIAGYALGIEGFTETAERDRFIGGAIDPNNQSIMILFALPLIVHLALFAKKRSERLTMAGLGFLNVFGLMLTMSRSGFLMGVLLALALLVHYRRRLNLRRIGAGFVGAFVAAMLLLVATPSTFFERQESLVEWQDRSLLRRTSYLGVAWDAFLRHPVIGSGPGTFIDIYGESEVTRLFTSKQERVRRHAHNTYLEVLVGTGLLGFGVYMAVLAYSVACLRRAERMFAIRGDPAGADLVACYRIGFCVLLVFLLMLSDMYHKYLLLSVGLSQLALWFAASPETARTGEAASGQAVSHSWQGGRP